MAYLHCHKCGWQQDDFWDEQYNPLRSLLNWEDSLLKSRLDEYFTQTVDEDGNRLLCREMLARKCERAARVIRNMAFRTEQEWKKPDGSHYGCPHCHSWLDVD